MQIRHVLRALQFVVFFTHAGCRVVRDQSQKKTVWDNPDQCEVFVNQLMEAAEKLTARNRKYVLPLLLLLLLFFFLIYINNFVAKQEHTCCRLCLMCALCARI